MCIRDRHVQPVGENEHEGNAEFLVVQSFQLLFITFHGEFPALFPKAPGEGNGVIVLVDRIRRILDVTVQRFNGLGACIIAGNQNLVSFEGDGYVLDFRCV